MSCRLGWTPRLITRLAWVPLVSALVGCAVAGPSAVSPAEIPDLEARLSQTPNNGALVLRYAAALFAAGRCDTAAAVAQRGTRLEPANVVGPLVVGQCHERADRYDDAVDLYGGFLADHGNAPGAEAVRGRHLIARRGQATAAARRVLAEESRLAAQPADPQAVAVLPLVISGDPSYQPLSRGLAQMITSDLDLIRQFRLVERLQLQALLDELQLGQTDRVDPATAARVGRLTRAGRLVQGLAAIPPDGSIELEASVVRETGEVVGAEGVDGQFRNLLRLEKELVIDIAARLGYTLSQAERARVLENGTQNLVAFLAYSEGLAEEDAGNFAAAAQHFARAVAADPGFTQAREQQGSASAANIVSQAPAGAVTTFASSGQDVGSVVAAPVADAINSAVGDIASTGAEQVTEGSTSGDNPAGSEANRTGIADQPPASSGGGSVVTIRIRVRLP